MELEIVRRQAEYDPLHVDRSAWGQELWADQKTNHVLLHIGKAGLKYARRQLAVIREEVVPDMAMATAQLVSIHSLNPNDIIKSERPPTVLSQMEGHLLAATGHLASYLEPLEHDLPGDKGQVFAAAEHLYHFTSGVADFFDIDIVTAHQERLAYLATVR